MTPASQLFIHQQVQKVRSDCSIALSRLRTARTVVEVRRASSVSCPVYLRSLVRSELLQVEHAAQRRAAEILQPELEKLERVEGRDLLDQLVRVRKLQQDLRGSFAQLFHEVDRALVKANQRADNRP